MAHWAGGWAARGPGLLAQPAPPKPLAKLPSQPYSPAPQPSPPVSQPSPPVSQPSPPVARRSPPAAQPATQRPPTLTPNKNSWGREKVRSVKKTAGQFLFCINIVVFSLTFSRPQEFFLLNVGFVGLGPGGVGWRAGLVGLPGRMCRRSGPGGLRRRPGALGCQPGRPPAQPANPIRAPR